MSANRKYIDLYRSLKHSTEIPQRTLVKGEIPKWLNGTLYRNGPGRYEFNGKSYKHIFDGQSCVHKFKIEDSQVFYSNKLLETNAYNKSLNSDRLFPAFGTSDASLNVYQRVKKFLKPSGVQDNVNVNIMPYGKSQLYAMTESNIMCRLDPKDLKILDSPNIKKHIPTARSTIAHPHIDHDGSWITLGMNTGKISQYDFIRYKVDSSVSNDPSSKNACQNAELIASVPSTRESGLSYFHSFGVTKNYIVFMEQAVTINFKQMLLAVIKNKPATAGIITEPNLSTRIHIIDKRTGKVVNKKFIAEPLFSFHYINAYETINSSNNQAEIILDVSCYDPNHFDINNFSFENMHSGKLIETKMLEALARRITIPLESASDEVKCETRTLNKDVPFELPVINYWKNNGLPYKYVYGVNQFRFPFSIIKLNVDRPNEITQMKYEKEGIDFLPSEPVFVENPSATATSEDDGVLLVMVLTSDKNDFLSILDAKTLKEVARCEIPEETKGAVTFHGFFADKQNFKALH